MILAVLLLESSGLHNLSKLTMYRTDLLVLQRRPGLSKLVLTQNRKILHRIESVLRRLSQKILYLRISRRVRTRSYTIRHGLAIQEHLLFQIE